MRILVVEDEAELAEALVDALTDEHHAVDHAADGPRASELFAIHDYDLVILDWSIPPPSGGELLQSWRAEGRTTPVLMLTGSKTSVSDKVSGLDIGADDYLTKPFAFAEVRARVRSLLRRRDKPVKTLLRAADLLLDPTARSAGLAGDPIHLSPKEFALLEYLLNRVDEVVDRGELAEHVWDEASDPSSNVVDVLIHRLRKKIDGNRAEKLLRTIPGVGYMLQSERS